MLRTLLRTKPYHNWARRNAALVIGGALLVLLAGCQKSFRVDDPQLRPIQEMLDAQLPPGTSQEKVLNFLATRGYRTEAAEKQGTVVAIIRHIDTQTVQPVTARVTFYFDANNKLNTIEIHRTMNEPIQ